MLLSFSQRRDNVEFLHTMVIKHFALEEPIYIKECSSTRFSLLSQESVINYEITKESLDTANNFYDFQEIIEKR